MSQTDECRQAWAEVQLLLRTNDRLKIEIVDLKKALEIASDELVLAHEALKREFVRNGIKEVTQ
jgi:hypothetical protein